jgi:CheY-like chemotaxis protein
MGTWTALVAEDHPHYLRRVSALLASLDVRAVTAVDGAQAIAHLNSHGRFDLLVTDLDMPHENGWAVIDAWLLAGLPVSSVIMVTGEADSRDVQERCRIGGIRLLHKVALDAHFPSAIRVMLDALAERDGDGPSGG